MGGLAVVVDWQRPVAPQEVDAMLMPVPHRTSSGVEHASFEHCVLAGSAIRSNRTSGQQRPTSPHLAIVGDLRLWNRDGLRSRAGGQSLTSGMSDSQLILEAYRRAGVDCFNVIDGDFAFVIWDDLKRQAIAVRDRFAAKPLFFERTPSGIRFASEPKQLVTTSHRPVEPCARSVAEYLTGDFKETRFTFFDGIRRVRPATALIADPTGYSELGYWDPSQDSLPPPSRQRVEGEFRDRLANAMKHRLEASSGAVSHLSGGLDSSAIAASAHILVDEGRLPAPFHTVSAVFPGHAIDESVWIDDIVSQQPFAHHDFIPSIQGIDAFDEDMWVGDQPRVNRIRDMWTHTALIGEQAGADLAFTGIGGDQVLNQDQFVLDRFRSGSPMRRVRDLRAHINWTGRSIIDVFDELVRGALPVSMKKAVRLAFPGRDGTFPGLVSDELRDYLDGDVIEMAPFEFDYPSLTQSGVVSASLHPLLTWINEVQEAQYASRGIGLSQPYLDKDLVEFVASLPVGDRPYDGRSKSLTRAAFSGSLPASVLNRRTKTVADEYLNALLDVHGKQYRNRYPEVSEVARPYLDSRRYAQLLDAWDARPPNSLSESHSGAHGR